MNNFIELFGYSASLVVALSLMMNSVVKLRWINMTGAIMFTIYGLVIGALPVAILNSFIIGINIWYLAKTYRQKDAFTTHPIKPDDPYLKNIIQFYLKDINQYHPQFSFDPNKSDEAFLILRNMAVAGIFLGKKSTNRTLTIQLDYALPKYRDFKTGKYVYQKEQHYFQTKGYNTLISTAQNKKHIHYFKKMGFHQNNNILTKEI